MKLRSLALVVAFVVAPGFARADEPTDAQIVAAARAKEYSLANLGFAGFRATVTPNWDVIMKSSFDADPGNADATRTMLNGLHFVLTVSADGTASLVHSADVPASTKQMQDAYNAIDAGMDQMIAGFFQTWSLLVVRSPFPDSATTYQLTRFPESYVLSHSDGSGEFSETLSHALVLTDLRISTPKYTSEMKPGFTPTPQGLLLSSFDATTAILAPGSTGNTQLTARVEYQTVGGFALPHRLNFAGTNEKTPFTVEVTLGDYVITAPS